MQRASLTRILSIAGALVSLVLVGYVLYQGSLALNVQKEHLFDTGFISWSLAALVFTTASVLVLPFAYVHVMASISPGDTGSNNRQLWSIYALTQIYKYLPGNIFHFVGRQLAIRKLGYRDGIIANASLIEMLSLAITAGLCILAAGNFTLGEILKLLDLTAKQWQYLGAVVVLTLVTIAVVVWYLQKSGIRINSVSFLKLLLLHLCHFVLASIGMLLVLRGLNIAEASFCSILVIYALAWILGTAMPGASAGIGVREAVIVALGYGLLATNLAVAALVFRILTVSADAVIWGLGGLIGIKPESAKSDPGL